MENVTLSVFGSLAAVDGLEGLGDESLSVLADPGELERGRVAAPDARKRPAAPPASYAVATHPLKRILDVGIAGFALRCPCCCWW